MGSSTAPLDLTFSDLERSKSRSLTFQILISRKGALLGPKLLLNINRKSYMKESNGTVNLTLSDIESSNSRSPNF